MRITYFAFHGFANIIDAPQTSILIASVKGLERVAQVRLCRKACKVGGQISTTTLGSIPRADDRVGDHQWEVIGVGPATALNGDGNVSEWHVIVTNADFRSLNLMKLSI